MYGTNCLSQLILDRYLCSCAMSAVWIYLATCIGLYNFSTGMYYVYNGFVFDFIAHCWATLSALRALLSSHIMTNKDDDDDNEVAASLKIIGQCSIKA